MKAVRKVGRPKKRAVSIRKERVHVEALALLRLEGVSAVTFRALAERLDVSPMAVSYHVGSRHQLLADLIRLAFDGTTDPPTGETSVMRIRSLLERYVILALAHADLVRCILHDPSLMSDELMKFTNLISEETTYLNNGDENDTLLNLIVDYTHGFVFSAIAAPSGTGPKVGDFLTGLDWILVAAQAFEEHSSESE